MKFCVDVTSAQQKEIFTKRTESQFSRNKYKKLGGKVLLSRYWLYVTGSVSEKERFDFPLP